MHELPGMGLQLLARLLSHAFPYGRASVQVLASRHVEEHETPLRWLKHNSMPPTLQTAGPLHTTTSNRGCCPKGVC